MLSFLLVFVGALAVVNAQNSQSVPPWQFSSMEWEWDPANTTWTQCSTLNFQWWQMANITTAIQPPYNLTFYLQGHEPYVLDAGPGTINGTTGALGFQWIVNLPIGGPYQVTLTDGLGAMGGDVSYIDITATDPPPEVCSIAALPTSTLGFNTTDNLDQCATINVTVAGGTPPYTFSAVEEWIATKTIHYANETFQYLLDIPSGYVVTMAVTDSTGKGAVGPQFSVGNSTDASCLTAAPTVLPLSPALTTVYPGYLALPTDVSSLSSSRNSGSSKAGRVAAIVGGCIGGLAFLVLLAIAFSLCQARYNKKDPAEGRNQNTEALGGFDGGADGRRSFRSTWFGRAAPPPERVLPPVPNVPYTPYTMADEKSLAPTRTTARRQPRHEQHLAPRSTGFTVTSRPSHRFTVGTDLNSRPYTYASTRPPMSEGDFQEDEGYEDEEEEEGEEIEVGQAFGSPPWNESEALPTAPPSIAPSSRRDRRERRARPSTEEIQGVVRDHKGISMDRVHMYRSPPGSRV